MTILSFYIDNVRPFLGYLYYVSVSGNTEVTQQMLEAGAKVSRENCVGRTASQMAAFVGTFIFVLIVLIFICY